MSGENSISVQQPDQSRDTPIRLRIGEVAEHLQGFKDAVRGVGRRDEAPSLSLTRFSILKAWKHTGERPLSVSVANSFWRASPLIPARLLKCW